MKGNGSSNGEIRPRIVGSTMQGYFTHRCAMECGHCNSKNQRMPDMKLCKFESVLSDLEYLGVKRVEFFANDSLLHPQIGELIEMANDSTLNYGLCTVGKSPRHYDVEDRFWGVVKRMDISKGSLVFSVDYAEDTAEYICSLGTRHSLYSEAFKALTFWRNSSLLKQFGIPVRANIVVSKNNIIEVASIAEKIAELGFAVSFCFVQTRHSQFQDILLNGLTSDAEKKFAQYIIRAGILDEKEVKKVVNNARVIVGMVLRRRMRDSRGIFNVFRGSDSSEAEILSIWLKYMKDSILHIKKDMKGENGEELLIPSEEFIKDLGFPGNGCLGLLRQGIFPQLKFGSNGQLIFCCDLHDPITQEFKLSDLRKERNRKKFLEAMRRNPYIWMCNFFNGGCDSTEENLYGGCHFSV